MRTAGAFCVLILAPLAALAEIAPPFVTKEEVNWRNRNADQLFEGNIGWEAVPFLPSPVLNRIRSTATRRKPKEEKDDAAAPSCSAAKA